MVDLAELVEIALIVIVLAVIAYWGANTFFKAKISRQLIADTTAFSMPSADYSKTLLVLGDSTGVGIGADKSEDSVAGRLAEHIGATYVENLAVSGTETAELKKQIAQAKLAEYSYILIHIGANDVLGLHSMKKTGSELGEALAILPKTAQILVLSAGNVGGATIFPHLLRPFHTYLTLKLHKEFTKACLAHRATYIHLYDSPWKDPFLRDPNRYLARDGLHPSTYGYGLWFDKVKKELQ